MGIPRGARSAPQGEPRISSGPNANPATVEHFQKQTARFKIRTVAWTDRPASNGGRNLVIFAPLTTDFAKPIEMLVVMHGGSSWLTEMWIHPKGAFGSYMDKMTADGRNFAIVFPQLVHGNGSKGIPLSALKDCNAGGPLSAMYNKAQGGDFAKLVAESEQVLRAQFGATAIGYKSLYAHSQGGTAVAYAALAGGVQAAGFDRITLADADYGNAGKPVSEILASYVKSTPRLQFNLIPNRADTQISMNHAKLFLTRHAGVPASGPWDKPMKKGNITFFPARSSHMMVGVEHLQWINPLDPDHAGSGASPAAAAPAAAASPVASAAPAGPGAPASPAASTPPPASLPPAPAREATLGSGDVATQASVGAAAATVIRLGSHSSEPPPAPAACPAPGAGGSAAPGAPAAAGGAQPAAAGAPPPPTNPDDPAPPQLLKVVNLLPAPSHTVGASTDVEGVARFVAGRAREGIGDIFAHPAYNTFANSGFEQFARTVAEHQTGIPYAMPIYFYPENSQKTVFKKLREEGLVPLAGQCQQSVTTALGILGWEGNAYGDVGSGTYTPQNFNGKAFHPPEKVPMRFKDYPEELWNALVPGTCFMWAKSVGFGHICMLLRKHPTKRLAQFWDTCTSTDHRQQPQPPGSCRATLYEGGWVDWMRRDCNGPFLGLGWFPELKAPRTGLKPRGQIKLGIWKRADKSLLYASDWLDMSAKGFPISWYLRSLRGAPFASELDVRWLLQGTNKVPLLSLCCEADGSVRVWWNEPKVGGKGARQHSGGAQEYKVRAAKAPTGPADPFGG